MTAYQILGGRLGLDHEPMFEVYQRYVSGSMVDLRRFRPDLPDALAALLARTYAPDPNARPQSAREFLDALERAAR